MVLSLHCASIAIHPRRTTRRTNAATAPPLGVRTSDDNNYLETSAPRTLIRGGRFYAYPSTLYQRMGDNS